MDTEEERAEINQHHIETRVISIGNVFEVHIEDAHKSQDYAHVAQNDAHVSQDDDAIVESSSSHVHEENEEMIVNDGDNSNEDSSLADELLSSQSIVSSLEEGEVFPDNINDTQNDTEEGQLNLPLQLPESETKEDTCQNEIELGLPIKQEDASSEDDEYEQQSEGRAYTITYKTLGTTYPVKIEIVRDSPQDDTSTIVPIELCGDSSSASRKTRKRHSNPESTNLTPWANKRIRKATPKMKEFQASKIDQKPNRPKSNNGSKATKTVYKAKDDKILPKVKMGVKKMMTCNVCDRKFVKESFYERHMAMHKSSEKKRRNRNGSLKEEKKEKSKEEPVKEKQMDKQMNKKNVKEKPVKEKKPRKGEITEVKPKPKSEVFSCTVCGVNFKKKTRWLIHKQTHAPDRLKCAQCDKTFMTKVLLMTHRWAVHDEKIGFICSVCKKVYPKKFDLMFHYRTHSGEKPYLCTQCGGSFARSKDLIEHQRKHSGERPYCCQECGQSFSASSVFYAHKKKHILLPYSCTLCPKRFTTETLLQKHRVLHDQLFECTACDKSFFTENSLKYHMKEHHSNKEKQKIECDVCHKQFSRRFNLKCHMTEHLGVRPHQCDQCPKAFSNQGHLATHLRREHNICAYKCDYDNCDESFPFVTDLRLHKREVHNNFRGKNGEEFYCDLCDKAFTRAGGLKRHILVHTGEANYTCDICEKGCKSASELKQHKKVHSNEKPYLCTFCGKAFKHNGNLTVHLRVHTGESPFHCEHCNKSFNQKSNLVTHQLKKHRSPGERTPISPSSVPVEGTPVTKMVTQLAQVTQVTQVVEPLQDLQEGDEVLIQFEDGQIYTSYVASQHTQEVENL